jgi:hypothetical protein
MAPAAAPTEEEVATVDGDWMPPSQTDPTCARIPPIRITPDVEGAFDAIFSELAKAAPDKSGVARNGDLLIELDSFRERVLAKLSEQREKRHAGLAAERDAAYAICRRLLDEIERLTNEYGKANSLALNFATSQLSSAATRVNFIQHSAPKRSSYPSKQEIQAWRNQLFAAEHELREKQAQHAELLAAANALAEEWTKCKGELKQAQEIEQRLTAQLEGKAYHDPKTGLYLPAQI